MATAPSPAPTRINIYAEYILPLIASAAPGETLYFCSPSAFFGYYSNGARCFDEVCDHLNDAKQRGVAIRLLIEVRDELDALAARNLVEFLDDQDEIRTVRNDGYYFVMLVASGDGRPAAGSFWEFNSLKEQAHRHLKGIRFRPYKDVNKSDHPEDRYHALRSVFDKAWDRAEPVERAIFRYSPSYAVHHLFVRSLGVFLAAVAVLSAVLTSLILLSFTTAHWAAIAASGAVAIVSLVGSWYFTRYMDSWTAAGEG